MQNQGTNCVWLHVSLHTEESKLLLSLSYQPPINITFVGITVKYYKRTLIPSFHIWLELYVTHVSGSDPSSTQHPIQKTINSRKRLRMNVDLTKGLLRMQPRGNSWHSTLHSRLTILFRYFFLSSKRPWGFPPSHLKLPHVPWFPLILLLWDLPGISIPVTFQATYPGAPAARSSWKAGFISYSDHSPGILRNQLPPPILIFPIKFMTSSSRTFYVQRSSAFVQLNFILTLTKLFLFDLSKYYNYRKELIQFCNCKT